jgi:hypothetical protein
VVAAALVAVVPREPAVPVRARLVVARVALLVQRPVPADPHPRRERAAPLLAQRPVPVHEVAEPAAALELLLSRQSSSAALARSST